MELPVIGACPCLLLLLLLLLPLPVWCAVVCAWCCCCCRFFVLHGRGRFDIGPFCTAQSQIPRIPISHAPSVAYLAIGKLPVPWVCIYTF